MFDFDDEEFEKMECDKATKCPFHDLMIEEDEELSLRGFVNKYCDGEKVNECWRKRMAKEHGKEKVPENMMPNGKPVSGTETDHWEDVIVEDAPVTEILRD